MTNTRLFRHHAANLLQTAVIMAALFALLVLIAWLFAGLPGILFVGVVGIPALLLGGRHAGKLVLRMYRAQPLERHTAPQLTELTRELARRAGLPEVPRLYYIPSAAPLAFSVGLGTAGAVALSDGLVRLLSWRELVGVVAHEVAHIAGQDTRVMGVADVASRLVSGLSFAGQVLIIVNLPLYLMGEQGMPWLPLFILVAAPLLMSLL